MFQPAEDVPVKEGTRKETIFTYVMFYSFGMASLIPSNFFTTATDYWMYKFRDPDSNASYNSKNETTEMQAQFIANFSIATSVGYALCIFLTVRFLKDKMTALHRIVGSLCVVIGLFILTCFFIRINTDSWQKSFLVFTLITGFFLNGMCGILMVTVIGLTMKFPRNFMVTMFSGQSICGILAALVQIFALGVANDPRTTGVIYFVIGLIFIICTLCAFLVSLKMNEFFSYHFYLPMVARKTFKFNKDTLKSALDKCKFHMISLFLTLGASIVIQPGVTSRVESVDKGNGVPWNDTFFVPTVDYLFYFLFDYVGREAAILISKPNNGLLLIGMACLRIALVPMIIFCNAQPRHHTSVAFNSDAAYIIILIIFALSNGYILNLCISSIPKITTDEEQPFATIGILILMILSLAVCSPISSAVVDSL